MDLFSKFDTDAGYFGPFRLRKDKYFTRPDIEHRKIQTTPDAFQAVRDALQIKLDRRPG